MIPSVLYLLSGLHMSYPVGISKDFVALDGLAIFLKTYNGFKILKNYHS